MDPGGYFLCAPADPSGTIEKVPFVDGDHRWDGGQFLLFANRNALLDHVPINLREIDDGTPYVNAVDRISPSERQSFFQTWFFFGLLAEFFALNDLDDQAPGDDVMKRRSSLQQLYDDFTVEEGARKYITISKLFEQGIMHGLMCSLRDHSTGQVSRFTYLWKCLKFTYHMVNMSLSYLEKQNWMSISAVGEFMSTAIAYAVQSAFLVIPNPPILTFPWPQHPQYMGRGSVENRMKDAGWCKSDIDRIGLTYQRLNTQHFLSHLKRRDLRWDHSSCSRQRCNAAHIVPQTYELSHAQDGCGCSEIKVNLAKVQQILRDTSTFPILRVHVDADLKSVTIDVEPYTGSKVYVAMSHVWADGLGNPYENSLHRCQISRLAKLIHNLQETVEAKTSESCEPYLLWIDTLCCPAVERQTKALAIERLPAVYTEAKHVLVLDSSIYSFFSEGLHPAEVCLRALASSNWMRRLWTLQEGALARSLYFQFADHPISIVDKSAELFQISMSDPRYRAIFMDVSAELYNLHGFFKKHLDQSYWNEQMWGPSTVFGLLWILQRALHFRSASVESDEPLCIATLLSLDLASIATVQGLEARMEQLWKQVASKGSGVSARIIFYVDNPIHKKGFGWAPKSLLGSDTYSPLDLNNLAARFLPSVVMNEPVKPEDLGSLSDYGLRVKLPGHGLSLNLWRENSPIWMWKGLLDTPIMNESVLCRHETTGRWFRVTEYLRWKAVQQLPDKELPRFGEASPNPLIEDLREGKVYLIRDVKSSAQGATVYLMAQVRQDIPSDSDDRKSMYVYSRRTVLLHEVDRTYARGLEAFREIAAEVAQHELTENLIQARKTESIESDIYQTALAKVVLQVIKPLFTKAFNTDSRVSEFFSANLGMTSAPNNWVVVPSLLPFEAVLSDMPENQSWVVDREI
ncbi:uncharacterized protein BDZ99DRAFT_483351 [Mytilinidion resinicola]|uniref:Heterokaryon incompatibility domain-containing protein n=1 Tax=Mytilinidion resinicola TaxID=574789 RepID=A0A6A6XZH2_9PEZI|nr:uncharacterized protein BDZ99DRAFT_483351 [Mytilinidion resinicola]KAF2801799.1 hypothetical protein BDZ99DRAFT_483351 [Mytilinidion resinicola]